MSKDFPSWAHALSDYFMLPVGQMQGLLDLGALPSALSVDVDPDNVPLVMPYQAVVALEQVRSQFDTPLEAFLEDLDNLASDLMHRGEADEPHYSTLISFRCPSFGLVDRCYPLTRFRKPWRRHRVAVTRAEVLAAGYGSLAALWSRNSDPFCQVPIGGEIPLGPQRWVFTGDRFPDINYPRGVFLERLVEVLEARQ